MKDTQYSKDKCLAGDSQALDDRPQSYSALSVGDESPSFCPRCNEKLLFSYRYGYKKHECKTAERASIQTWGCNCDYRGDPCADDCGCSCHKEVKE